MAKLQKYFQELYNDVVMSKAEATAIKHLTTQVEQAQKDGRLHLHKEIEGLAAPVLSKALEIGIEGAAITSVAVWDRTAAVQTIAEVVRHMPAVTSFCYNTGGEREVLNPEALEAIARNPNLTDLTVRWDRINLEGIEKLTLGYGEDSVGVIRGNSGLRSLDFAFSKLGDQGVGYVAAALSPGCALAHLNLAGCGISSRATSVLGTILRNKKESLVSLQLSSNDLDDEGVKTLFSDPLSRPRKLTHLDMSLNDISGEGAEALAALIMDNKDLQELKLGSNRFGDEGVKTLAAALAEGKNLTQLDLSHCGMGDEGLSTLLDALRSHEGLTHLNLNGCKMGEEGVRALAGFIRSTKSLTHLDLSGCGLGDKEITVIAAALQENKTVTHLNLGHNVYESMGLIDKEGATALAALIRTNTMLTDLNLWLSLRNGDARAIVTEALCDNRTIEKTTLDVHPRDVFHEHQRDLLTLMRYNDSITYMGYEGGNYFDDKIDACLERNRHDRGTLADLTVEEREAIAVKELEKNIKELGRQHITLYGSLSGTGSLRDKRIPLKLGRRDIRDISPEKLAVIFEKGCREAGITALDFSEGGIGEQEAKAIAQALRSNTAITALSLAGNPRMGEGVGDVGRMLSENSTLRRIDLSNNHLGDKEVKGLVEEGLQHNRSIKKVLLGHNAISDRGMQDIAAYVATNSPVAVLDVSFNNFGDVGAQGLSVAVRGNTHLKELHMECRMVETPGKPGAYHHSPDPAIIARAQAQLNKAGSTLFGQKVRPYSTFAGAATLPKREDAIILPYMPRAVPIPTAWVRGGSTTIVQQGLKFAQHALAAFRR